MSFTNTYSPIALNFILILWSFHKLFMAETSNTHITLNLNTSASTMFTPVVTMMHTNQTAS